jgi:hypothetical protein
MVAMYENEREVIIYMTTMDKEILYHKKSDAMNFGGEFIL